MMDSSLVSVCIPAYNCERYIGATLKCICCQSHKNIEIIVVNDGSADGTLSEIKKINDERVKLIETQNAGAAKARNAAYRYAKGEYIIFFDADDYIKPDFIKQQLTAVNGRNDVVAMAAWGRFYNDDINSFRQEQSPEISEMTFADWINYYWYNCNPMTNPGRAIIPRKLIEHAGEWNENLSLNDDLEFFTRVFIKASGIVINNEAVFYYRSGIGGLSAYKGDKAYQSLFNSIRYSVKYVIDHYGRDKQIIISCANMWQSFIYIVYPEQKALVKKTYDEIKELAVKPAYPFSASGVTKILSSVIGWKLTQWLKYSLRAKH